MRATVHLSMALYLAITGLMCAATGQAEGTALHVLGIAALLLLRRWPRRLVPLMLPLAALPALYQETGRLNGILWGRTFDAQILALENALFGRSPALWMSEALPSYWLSETLHLCYMAFWLLIPVLALDLYRRNRLDDLDAFLFTSVSAFLCCYLAFILMPVDGPRGIFPPIDARLQGPIYRLCHAVVGHGAAERAAFPSGHVAVSVVCAACAWRWHRTLFPLVAAIALGITLATVYGRFHYALDSLAGLLFAWRLYLGVGPRALEHVRRAADAGTPPPSGEEART